MGSSSADPAFDVLNAHTFRPVARLPDDSRCPANAGPPTTPRESLFMSPDGRTVYYAYASPAPPASRDRDILIAGRYRAGGCSRAARVSARGLVAIRLIDNGTRLVVLGDTAAQTLDARTLAPQRTVPLQPAGQLGYVGAADCCIESVGAISPDGTSAAVGSPDGTISFIDLSTGAIHAAAGGHAGSVQSVRYSPERTDAREHRRRRQGHRLGPNDRATTADPRRSCRPPDTKRCSAPTAARSTPARSTGP